MSITVEHKEVQTFFQGMPRHVGVLNEVLDAIQAAPLQDSLDVLGTIVQNSNVLRVNTLTFYDDAVLVFTDVTSDFIVIAAQELVIDLNNPNVLAVITRPVGSTADQQFATMLEGANGANGANGAAGVGQTSHRGNDGGAGKNGMPGGNGGTLTLPDIFLFTQQLTLGANTPPNTEVLTFFFNGVLGGNGGKGGNGGEGGAGARGADSSSGVFNCNYSGGDGGTGGPGGQAGRGGNAGNGGDGAWVSFYSPIGSQLNLTISVQQQGAPAGVSGTAGVVGRGGLGGQGGSGSTWCGGGHGGSSGSTPPPATAGSPGQPGNRGVFDNEVRDNQDLW